MLPLKSTSEKANSSQIYNCKTFSSLRRGLLWFAVFHPWSTGPRDVSFLSLEAWWGALRRDAPGVLWSIFLFRAASSVDPTRVTGLEHAKVLRLRGLKVVCQKHVLWSRKQCESYGCRTSFKTPRIYNLMQTGVMWGGCTPFCASCRARKLTRTAVPPVCRVQGGSLRSGKAQGVMK